MRNSEQVTFGDSGLNRAAELRGDQAAQDRLLTDPRARVAALWRGKPLMAGDSLDRAVWLPPDHAIFVHAIEAPIFLGIQEDGAPYFAHDISSWVPNQDTDTVGDFTDHSEQHYPGLPEDQKFGELRMVMARLSARDAELVATAKALTIWHETHSFCANCGVKSEITNAGWQRNCPACHRFHFPRTDPVVIMLITRGNNVLIGRSPGWPEGMYSLLAGFVEPGETLEAAVRREVIEEAGIHISDVTYLASQPWPFPASLMIGCRGIAESDDITIDPDEIEDAIWVSREEMAIAHSGQHSTLKSARHGSIAHFLVGKWLADRLD